MRRAIDTGRIVGAVALAGGVLALGITLGRALRTEPIPPDARGSGAAMAPSLPPSEVAVPARAAAPSSRQIMQAARGAPFDPERRAPRQRYQLPGQRVQEEIVVEEPTVELPPAPALRVLGTIAGGDAGVAVMQAEGEEPRVITEGQTIGGYLVVSVEEEAVVVSLRGFPVTLALEEGMAVGQSGDTSDRQARRGRPSNENTRQQLEAFVQALQQRLAGGSQVVVEGGRAYLVGPDGQRREIQLPAGLARLGRNVTIRPTVIPPGTPPPDAQDGQGSSEAAETVTGGGVR